jgi:hypothetical protein
MSRGVAIEVRGLPEIIKKFKGFPENVKTNYDAELHELSEEYANKAIQSAPRDRGLLIQGISADHQLLFHETVSSAPYSAYQEFGTRSKVQVPPELAAYAAQFRGKKSNGDAKKAIYDWCKRVGIPKEAWYPIFIKIMTVGVSPHPFFFIHLNWAQSEVQKRAQKVVKNALK